MNIATKIALGAAGAYVGIGAIMLLHSRMTSGCPLFSAAPQKTVPLVGGGSTVVLPCPTPQWGMVLAWPLAFVGFQK